jgi:succinyl-diaminopimelate desuccinylase
MTLDTLRSLRIQIEQQREEIIRFLCGLISIPTANPPGDSYRECVEYLSQKLSRWKIAHRVILLSRGKYPRYAIVSRWDGYSNAIHFHGHYDVIPPLSRGQVRPRLAGGRIYGRGSSDMKGGLAAMLFSLRMLQEKGVVSGKDVTFSIVPDEETGGRLGTQRLIENGVLPQGRWGMIMPEPTGGDIWYGNNGALTVKITVKGKSAHVGLAHQGINAFEGMIDVVESFRRMRDRWRYQDSSVMLIGGRAGSGLCPSLVPDDAHFTVDCRLNSRRSLDVLKRRLMAVVRQMRNRMVPMAVEILQEGGSSRTDPHAPMGLSLRRAVRLVKGRPSLLRICPGLLEIRFFNRCGVPAYAFGPGRLEVAHGPQEYIRIRDILDAVAIYVLVVQPRRFTGADKTISS